MTGAREAPPETPACASVSAQIAFGFDFACALTTAGRAKCRGLGGAGQLGNGSTSDAYIARDVAGTAGEPFIPEARRMAYAYGFA